MRFFIALEIPEGDKQALKNVQNRLLETVPGVKLTDSNKLHLTLVFVGEQKDELKESLIEIVSRAADGIHPFSVTPSYIDGFPNIHNPHTLWVGVKGDVDKLHILREKIKDGLKELNLPVDERKFIPHIAVGKTSNIKITPRQEDALEKMMAQGFQPIQVSSIKLFESVPDQGLHQHNTLAEIKLS